MSVVNVQVKGLNDVRAAIGKYGKNLAQEIVDITGQVQALVVNDARMNHPYTDRTGNLTQSIQPGPVEATERMVSGVIEARMQYASFVEFGTSRARPFPFLVPAMLRIIPRYRESVKAAIAKAKAS